MLPTEDQTKTALAHLATCAGVLLLAFIGIELTRQAERVASIWFANGVVVAILLRQPLARWRGFLVAALIGNVWADLLSGDPIELAMLLSLANSIEILLAAGLTRLVVPDSLNLARATHFRIFVLGGVLLPTLVSASIGAMVIENRFHVPFLDTFRTWLPADLLGMVIVVPLSQMNDVSNRRWFSSWSTLASLLPYLAMLALITSVVFAQTRYPLLFVVQLPLLAMVYRFGRLGAGLGMFVTSVIALMFTSAGHGPMALVQTNQLYERILFLHLFLLFAFALTYAVNILIEDRAQLIDNLQRSRQNLRDVTDNVPALISQLGPDQVFRFANAHHEKLFRLDPQEMIGRTMADVLGAEIHGALQPHIEKALRGQAARFEHRIRFRGRGMHLLADLIPERDAEGKVEGFYAFVLDITARKEAELQQAASEDRLKTITDNMPALITCVDRERRIRFSNGTYRDWLGLEPGDLLDGKFDEVLPEDWVRPQQDAIREALAGMRSEVSFEAKSAGRQHSFRSTFVPQTGPDGRAEGVYILTADISALKTIQKQLLMLAQFDALTGLANRREFEARLDQALSRSRRSEHFVAVLFIDIDHFKTINDTRGHGGGDTVLQELSLRIKAAIRSNDVAGRLAGDEFAVLLEGVHDSDEAQFVARKVLAVTRRPFLVGGLPMQVGISIGIALNWNREASSKDLLSAADGALYESKRNGRGTTSISKPQP